jgi:hypothetical protein
MNINPMVRYNAEYQQLELGLSFLSTDLGDVLGTDGMTFNLGAFNAGDYYNQPQIDTEFLKKVDGLRTEYYWHFNDIIDRRGLQVSASFNPYSQYNIIGSLQEEYSNGPMLFDYRTREDEIRIKICDAYGTPILTQNMNGFIDLELIVDNSSNYSINA